jgi:hypothetical protein
MKFFEQGVMPRKENAGSHEKELGVLDDALPLVD